MFGTFDMFGMSGVLSALDMFVVFGVFDLMGATNRVRCAFAVGSPRVRHVFAACSPRVRHANSIEVRGPLTLIRKCGLYGKIRRPMSHVPWHLERFIVYIPIPKGRGLPLP